MGLLTNTFKTIPPITIISYTLVVSGTLNTPSSSQKNKNIYTTGGQRIPSPHAALYPPCFTNIHSSVVIGQITVNTTIYTCDGCKWCKVTTRYRVTLIDSVHCDGDLSCPTGEMAAQARFLKCCSPSHLQNGDKQLL